MRLASISVSGRVTLQIKLSDNICQDCRSLALEAGSSAAEILLIEDIRGTKLELSHLEENQGAISK